MPVAKQAFLLPLHLEAAGGRVAAGLHGLHPRGGAGPDLQAGAGQGDHHHIAISSVQYCHCQAQSHLSTPII